MADINIAPVRISSNSLVIKIFNEVKNRFYSGVHLINLDLDVEAAFYKERAQYFSTQLIADVIPKTERIDGKVILITEVDLFVPVLTFVYGEAQLNGKHSIVSLCRLHEEFYSEQTDESLLIERTVKEVLHELGHNFGLRHCVDWDCVMHASQRIEEVDIKGSGYCHNCAKTIDGWKG